MARRSTALADKAARKVWRPLPLFDHQRDAEGAFQRGIRRLYLAWHRRAGKDVFGLDFARKRMEERIGTYWHLFPFHVQAKRAIWNGIDARTGQRFIDRAFPASMRESENNTDMSFVHTCGSTWQMLGSDNYDRMVGSNPCGIIFSEWALCNPAAWDYIRPILIENKGWAMFITTFRGRNHAWRMFEDIKALDSWYADKRTILETHRLDGSPIVTQEDVDQEICEGMDPALVQQEFFCNPDAASSGAIFSTQYSRLLGIHASERIESSRLIRVAWGIYDEGITAIAFQDFHCISVHTFLESNIVDAVQAVARRHPNARLVHHAIDPDPTLFSSLDGMGVVRAPVPSSDYLRDGYTARLLNKCTVSSTARETLADFAMQYAPHRKINEEFLTHPSTAQALAVMQSAQFLSSGQSKPLDYSRSDRGII